MSSNKIIFVISSNYLEAVHRESTKYNFELIGCGSFTNACKLIPNVSVGSLLGISILEQQLPDPKSYEGKQLLELISILGDLQQPVRLNIILTKGTIDQLFVKCIKKFANIDCYGHTNAEAVTDSLINGEVFGSLLLQDTNMYKIGNEAAYVLHNDALKTININNYFSEYLLHIFGLYVEYETLEQTCIHDPYYKEYSDSGDEILCGMRAWYIGIKCGFEVKQYKERVYNSLMSKFESETFPERFIMYNYLEGLE